MPETRHFVSSPSSFIKTLHTSLVCNKNVKWQNWQQSAQKKNLKMYYCLKPHIYLTRGVFENINVRTRRRTHISNLIFCFLCFNHWETIHVFLKSGTENLVIIEPGLLFLQHILLILKPILLVLQLFWLSQSLACSSCSISCSSCSLFYSSCHYSAHHRA